jgi:hypothetical protein
LNETSRRTVRRTGVVAALIATFAFPGAPIWAQTVGAQTVGVQSGIPSGNPSEASLTLPDEPGLLRASSSVGAAAADPQSANASTKPAAPASGSTLPEASRMEMVIEPGQVASSLTSGDKVVLGLKDAYSPFAVLGWIATAGYEQVTNSSPNYGSDRGAFGERLGAAAIRDSTDGILTNSLMSPIFREDPRYYRMGPTRNFFVRVIYSGTRPLITRTDSGRLTPNFANVTGTLEGSALTNLYYPQVNRGAKQTFETFGGSLVGDALADLVSEFYKDFTAIFRSEHK